MGPKQASKEAAPPSKHQTAAQLAEAAMREKLGVQKPPVNYKTGRIDGNANMPHIWATMKRNGNCCIGSVVKTNPLANPNATLQQHYQSQQEFGAFNPLVSGMRWSFCETRRVT